MKTPTGEGGRFRLSYVRGGRLTPTSPTASNSDFRATFQACQRRSIIQAVRTAISPARMGTFETAVPIVDDADPRALALYAWNARISAALLAPLHICEIVVRNAVSDAIEQIYGPRWPWQIGFEQSLPSPRSGYNPQRDLQNARSHATTTGKAIPELKFVFWQKMFTSRHDQRLWEPYLRQVMPHLEPGQAGQHFARRHLQRA